MRLRERVGGGGGGGGRVGLTKQINRNNTKEPFYFKISKLYRFYNYLLIVK